MNLEENLKEYLIERMNFDQFEKNHYDIEKKFVDQEYYLMILMKYLIDLHNDEYFDGEYFQLDQNSDYFDGVLKLMLKD